MEYWNIGNSTHRSTTPTLQLSKVIHVGAH